MTPPRKGRRRFGPGMNDLTGCFCCLGNIAQDGILLKNLHGPSLVLEDNNIRFVGVQPYNHQVLIYFNACFTHSLE